MAEYWKSLPRKFCDICKCWFADNKASIDFHERGKRHQENAQKRIQDIQKKSVKEFKKQQKLEDEMEKIEKAALAAYEKDLQNMQGGNKSQPSVQSFKKPSSVQPNFKSSNNSEVAKNGKSSNKISEKKKEIVNTDKAKEQPSSTSTKLWYEGMTEEGYKYYWNSETSESTWEPPEEEYISIEEQNQTSYETITEGKCIEEENNSVGEKEDNSVDEEDDNSVGEEDDNSVGEEDDNSVDEEDNNRNDTPSSIGPQPKADPYGQWVTVEKGEPVEYDLQLPKLSEDVVEVFIPIHKEETSLKFKEKVIGQLTDCDSSEVTFKKRKFSGAIKRNARQRTADDD